MLAEAAVARHLILAPLLQRGAAINEAASDGFAALYAAAQEGHVLVVRALLERGADMNQESNNGESALQVGNGRKTTLGY